MIANILFRQHKKRLYTRTSPVNTKIKLITFFVAKKGEAVYSQQNQDLELIVAQIISISEKFRLKLKKVRKTTRPSRYNLNQIPYEYAVEVTNRLKRLDPVNSVPEELRTEVCNNVQEAVNKTVAKRRKEGKVVI